MTEQKLDKILTRAFPDRKLTPDEKTTVRTVLEHIELHGIEIPPIEEKKENYDLYLSFMDRTLKEEFDTSLKEIMDMHRTEKKVKLRNFCWERFKRAYPLLHIEKARELMGDGRQRVSIQHGIKKVRDWVSYDKKIGQEYRRFNAKMNELIEHADNDTDN